MNIRILFSLILLWIIHPRASYGQEEGLLGYWKFDEGKDSVVGDSSGNGHHGSIKNARWVQGKIKSALRFEEGSFVEIPDHPELRLQKDFTITAWVNKTAVSKKGKSMGIMSKSNSDAWDFDLFMSTSRLEHPAFYSDAFQASGGDIEVLSEVPISLNEWHHIAVTRMDSEAKIWIDGIVTGSATIPEDLTFSGANLYIGYDHDGGFEGSIDEVRMYNRALTGIEIKMVMNPGNPPNLSFEHIVVDDAFGGILEIAPIDEDKYPDIIHGFWYDSAPLAWYEYQPSGTWKKHPVRENFYPVTDNFDISDIDGDGDNDIVMATSESKRSDNPKADYVQIDEVQIVWFQNPRPESDPGINKWKKHLIGIHVDSHENYIKDIKAADFTKNGIPEIVVRSDVALSVFQKNGDVGWKQVQYIKIHPHEGLDVGDVDCDGDLDIVLNGFWLECPENPTTGSWAEHIIDTKWWQQTGDWTINSCKVYVKDVNGDGCSDVLLSHSEQADYPVSWYELDKSGKDKWQEHVIQTVDFCHTLQAGDMDCDGDIDVVVGEMEKSEDPDQIIVFLNEGAGLTWKKHVVANKSIYSGKVADIDHDGDLDIVGTRNFNKPPLEIWKNLIFDAEPENPGK